MSENKISVIIPVYNTERYLDKCIESVVNQTYKNLEIILVDDGSTDKSGIICDNWKEKDERIIVIHKENGGVSSARNIGLKYVTGNYIAWLDSDDWIESDMYGIMMEAICKNTSDVVVCDYTKDSNKVDSQQKIKYKNYNRKKATEEVLKGGLTSFLWDKLYRAELFHNISFQGVVCEDLLANSKIFLEADTVTLINHIGYHYIERSNSLTHDNKAMLGAITAAVNIKNNIENVYPELRKHANYTVFSANLLGYNYIYKDDTLDGIKKCILCNLKKQLRHLPWIKSSLLQKKVMTFGLLVVLKNIFKERLKCV